MTIAVGTDVTWKDANDNTRTGKVVAYVPAFQKSPCDVAAAKINSGKYGYRFYVYGRNEYGSYLIEGTDALSVKSARHYSAEAFLYRLVESVVSEANPSQLKLAEVAKQEVKTNVVKQSTEKFTIEDDMVGKVEVVRVDGGSPA